MEVGEAISVAQRVKNHYRAFEKLEEALKVYASLQTQENELRSAIIAQKEQKTALTGEIASLNSELEEVQKRNDLLSRAAAREAQNKVKRITEQVEGLIRDSEERRDNIESDIEKREIEHAERVTKMDQETAEKQKTLDDINGRIAQIRQTALRLEDA